MNRLIKCGRQTGIVIAFLTIIYIPLCLAFVSWISGYSLDITLNGYTDKAENVVFTWENLCSGNFQNSCEKWIDSNIRPRGIMVHFYNTLRYNLFNVASNPIADNGDVLEDSYLREKCCIGTNYDYSISDNKNKMDAYVLELNEIQQKLRQHGKFLFVYIAPSKADWDYEYIPQKYINMREDNSVRMYDYFKKSISETNVAWMDCDELYSALEYPAFYATGIHWSRTFEQRASQQIIGELSELTGNNYREILLGDVRESEDPFWRDSDVFDNLNLWNRRNEMYYEYVDVKEQEEFNKLRILLYGDSFGRGLVKDVLDRYPFEDVFYINYGNYVQTRYAETTMLNQNWNNLDFAYYLDRSDVVAIEMTKPCIGECSCGFAEALNTALDTYVEGTTFQGHLGALDPTDETVLWDTTDVFGIYEKEDGFVWAKKDSQIVLDAECIKYGGGGENRLFSS